MNTLFRYLGIIFFGILFGKQGITQPKTTIFYEPIKNYDLSVVLMADSIFAEEEIMIKRDEILGFIGDDYQRMYVKFISIIQNSESQYEYFAYGKIMVKKNICEFQGVIKIISSEIYNTTDIPSYKQGFVVCEVVLYENKYQTHTGFFKGKLISNFLIDAKEKFRYDAIMFGADGFLNNQFTGMWINYKTKTSKICNWGDYRIPNSGNLDSGASLFLVDEKYIKNGWETYMNLNGKSYLEDSLEYKKALQKENEKWWK
jgi:hypothetical protein